MDMKNQHRFSSPTIQTIRLGRSYTKPHYLSSYHDGPKPVWQVLWRKLKRDKRRIFGSSTPTVVEGVNDEESYSMNFDQGTGWMEPDNLPRSFSSRYADPSRILLPPRHLLDWCLRLSKKHYVYVFFLISNYSNTLIFVPWLRKKSVLPISFSLWGVDHITFDFPFGFYRMQFVISNSQSFQLLFPSWLQLCHKFWYCEKLFDAAKLWLHNRCGCKHHKNLNVVATIVVTLWFMLTTIGDIKQWLYIE